ncbi:hypothetical protein RDWZM_002403 [Blomia tropicalis]|uniref:Adenosine 3'-phospho 5'-phosphosulfate transporter 1 n=1 Tax=Blomia tropicalis TaxID=40697 RepID=A0A9Q0MF28_BLOTA|nr:hypothetical protein RDWZM_002403 [Blomia tropicalis]
MARTTIDMAISIFKNTKYLSTNRYVQLFVYGREDGQSASIQYDHILPIIKSDITNDRKSKFSKDALQLVYCFVGLQISYLTWGILQEKIMTQDYVISIDFFQSHSSISNNLISIHQKGNSSTYIKFRNSQFLVFVNRVLACSIAISILIYRNRNNLSQYFFRSMQPPGYQYLYCSLSNILSSWCQYEALKYVSFPVQVLSKGCKIIAVMIMSVALRGKRYKRIEWLFAIAISFGVWLFLINEQQEQKAHAKTENVLNESSIELLSSSRLISGILILALYLTFDSFTSNWQSELFDRYKISSIHMMAAVNCYSILLTSISLIQQSDFVPAFKLLFDNQSLFQDCILLSICSAIGQLFVYHTISTFGPVVFTLIMTLRQVFAILLSIFIYSHTISIYGIFGIIVVFSSIYGNMYLKYSSKTAQNRKP